MLLPSGEHDHTESREFSGAICTAEGAISINFPACPPAKCPRTCEIIDLDAAPIGSSGLPRHTLLRQTTTQGTQRRATATHTLLSVSMPSPMAGCVEKRSILERSPAAG